MCVAFASSEKTRLQVQRHMQTPLFLSGTKFEQTDTCIFMASLQPFIKF